VISASKLIKELFMRRIACIGIAVQDRIYYVDSLPAQGGKYVALDYKEVGGGPAATAAVAIARLGVEVDYIGRVGDDSVGKALLEDLQKEGVNTRLSQVYDGARSSQSAILVDKQGERIIINHQSPDLPTDAVWLESIDFSGYDIVLADVRWPLGAEKAFLLARKAGVTTLLDADMTPQDISPLVSLADHAAFSQPGLQKMTGYDDPLDGLIAADKVAAGTAYVTCGKSGCYWVESGDVVHHAGFSVNVVDTTGAGDVFHGALAVALAEKQPLSEAVRFANAVAALKCTRPGGRAGIPNRDQIDAFLLNSV
jgi:sulfofructose kinase